HVDQVLSGDRDVKVVVVPSGDAAGVVHAAAVVDSPALGAASHGPDAALPDEVLDAEGSGVGLHPVGDLPSEVERGTGCGGPDGVAERAVAGPAERVFGLGARPRGPARPRGTREVGADLGQHVCGPFGDLAVGGRVVDQVIRVGAVVGGCG